jgi:very-short-patch-repair endonuclease
VGVRVHRRSGLRVDDLTERDGIPVTAPVLTLVDLAASLSPRRLERAVDEADRLDLIDPEHLLLALDTHAGRRGTGRLRALLEGQAFRLTDSELERRFLRLVRRAGLPVPRTGVRVSGFRVDFLWPDRGLVVETDGLRYHRTPSQQARDRERDQALAAAGLTTLRFTHGQVQSRPGSVARTVGTVLARLAAGVPTPGARGTAGEGENRTGTTADRAA